MNQYLLAVSIGPVQEFIAAGRKTRDLWFGSHLLSEIAKATARELRTHGELIFPDNASLDADTPAPNKLLALLKENAEPADIVEKLKGRAFGVLEEYQRELLGEYREDVVDHELVKNQVSNFLEMYAAWRLIDPDQTDASHQASYKCGRDEVERLLAGRKALRDFAQPMTTFGRRKSSLDPSRESAIRPDATSGQRARLRLKGHEELDGVSLIKRTCGEARFVSTARIAVDPFIHRLAFVERRQADLDALISLCKKPGIGAESFPANDDSTPLLGHYAAFPYDTQLFYDPGTADAEVIDKVRAERFFAGAQALRKSLPGVVEIPAYLAVVQADGDRMGALIGQLQKQGQHQAFSKHLSRFANDVKQTTSRHHGALIYSGGDDVLAFLPLDQALGYAQAIHDEFALRIAALTRELRRDHGLMLNDPPSLSVGIAIGHYAENLNRLLEWARETESYAKNGERDVFAGRNALAVAYYPRGAGEPSARAGHSWTDDPVRSRWGRWVRYHRHDLLPDGAGYEIRRLAREFEPQKKKDVLSVLNLELGRILRRKRSGHGGDPELLSEVHDAIAGGTGTSRAELLRLASELIVSREVAATLNMAVGKPPSLAIETRWRNAAGFVERTLTND